MPQAHTACHNGYSVNRIHFWQKVSNDRVACFVVSSNFAVFLALKSLFGRPKLHFSRSLFDIFHIHFFFIVAGGINCSLIKHVLEVCPGEAHCPVCHPIPVDRFHKLFIFRVNFKYRKASLFVRHIKSNSPVKPAGPKKRRIQEISSVCGSDNDHIVVGCKPVHLDQYLI